jgi:hypothetical protein
MLGGTWVPGATVPGYPVPVPSYSAASGMCGAINEVFDECRAFLGYRNCQTSCMNLASGCAVVSSANYEKGQTGAVTVNTQASPKVTVFPNPYLDNVNFIIESPVAAKASLKVYNAMGQLVSVVFNGEVSAGKSRNIHFNTPSADGSLFYIYEQNGQKLTGKLIKQ